MCKIECGGTWFGKWLVAIAPGLLLVACERAHLQMEPAIVSECQTPAEVSVSWDVSAFGLEEAYLEITGFGRKPKLWVHEGGTGSHRTGKWMYDGSSISLYAMDGTRLARRTFVTTPCENGQGMIWRW